MSNYLYDRRVSMGLTQKEVAKAVGVSEATVSRWESGNIANMKRDKIFTLSRILKCSPEFIMTGQKDFNTPQVSPGAVRIPVLGSIPAGTPLEAIEDVVDWEELPAAMTAGGKEFFALQVKGDSMWPDILPGDVVIVKRVTTCNSGEVCVVFVNGFEATLKEVRLDPDNNTLTIVPRNPNYPPRTFTPDEIKSLPVAIAGVVVELRRKMK